MNRVYRDEWVAALRSGEYNQARHMLKTGDGFCCLGVYADVRGMELTKDGTGVLVDGEDAGYNPIGEEIGREFLYELYNRNDGIGIQREHTFTEIADWIEANIPVEEPVIPT